MKFEEVGQALDREIAKLRNYVTNDWKSKSRRDVAKMIRKTSQRLGELAEKLEKSEPGNRAT